MPFCTDYLSDGRGAVQTGEGEVTVAELLVEVAAVRDNPAAMQHDYVLVDFSAMTRFRASVSDLRALIQQQTGLAAHATKIAMAVVAPKDAVFGTARMWESLAYTLPWEIRVARSRAEAIAWLRQRRPGAFPALPAADEALIQAWTARASAPAL